MKTTLLLTAILLTALSPAAAFAEGGVGRLRMNGTFKPMLWRPMRSHCLLQQIWSNR